MRFFLELALNCIVEALLDGGVVEKVLGVLGAWTMFVVSFGRVRYESDDWQAILMGALVVAVGGSALVWLCFHKGAELPAK
jgi:hypothetical protein